MLIDTHCHLDAAEFAADRAAVVAAARAVGVSALVIPAVETALIGALDAPLAPLWILLFFGDLPGQATIVGGGIVLAAVVGHILYEARPRPRR